MPTPGSPPICTTEPSTRPPPSTRSSSSSPLPSRTSRSEATSARVFTCEPTAAPAYPPSRALRLLAADGAATPSTSVFHSPQSGHCPAHIGHSAPHSLQRYMDFTLLTVRRAPACTKRLDITA